MAIINHAEQTFYAAVVRYKGEYKVISDDDPESFEKKMDELRECVKGKDIQGPYTEINQKCLEFINRVVEAKNTGKDNGLARLLK